MDTSKSISKDLKTKKPKSIKNKKGSKRTNKSKNKENSEIIECYSNQNNCLIGLDKLDEISLIQKDSYSNNLVVLNEKYKKELNEKYSLLLDKKKFKLANNFDAKNSKKFLDKKDKCLEKIVLSDAIDDDSSTDNDCDSDKKLKKNKYYTQKNLPNYIIIISDYDEEQQGKYEFSINDIISNKMLCYK